MEDKKTEMAAKEILAELNKTANLISNATDGDVEKSMSVSFMPNGKNKNDIFIDAKKFMTDDGSNIAYNEKAIMEEKGRILATQEMGRSKTFHESKTLEGFSSFVPNKGTKKIFEGILTKNSLDAVKAKWEGFKPEIESFQESVAVSKTVTKESSLDKKLEAILEKWTLPQSEVDFGDTGIQENWGEFKDILDHVAKEFQYNPNPLGHERLEIAKKIHETIKKKIVEVDEEKPKGDGDDKNDDKEDDDNNDDGNGKSKSNGEPKPESEKSKPESEESTSERMLKQPSLPKDQELNQKLLNAEAEPSDEPSSFVPPQGSADPAKVKYLLGKTKVDKKAKESFKDFLVKYRRAIETIKQSFAFKQVKLTRPDYGKTAGDVDINGLSKFHLGEKIRLFETREVPKGKQYTIGILLDQSGSMGGDKINHARTVTNILLQAIKGIKGIDIVVYGHTADSGGHNTITIFPYCEKGMDNSASLTTAKALSNNGDGYAIRWVSQKMLDTNPANKNSIHHLFVVSDGQPSCASYGGSNGITHTKACVDEARKNGVEVFGIGIQNAYSTTVGQQLFGNGNFVVLNDTLSSLPLLAKSIKKLVSK